MNYERNVTAATLPSLEDVARAWGLQVGEACLKAIPARYKLDKAVVEKGNAKMVHVKANGTGLSDLDVSVSVVFIVDVFRGETVGTVFWEEVGRGKQEHDFKFRADAPASDIVDFVMKVVARNERG